MADVKGGRLKDALAAAKRCAVALGMWQQLDMLSAHERTYRAMVEYMDAESDIRQRHRALAVIKEDLLRLADSILLNMDMESPRAGRESDLYNAAVRTRRLSPEPGVAQLIADIELAADAVRRYNSLDTLFNLISTTQHLGRPAVAALEKMLADADTDADAAMMVLSALGVANLYYYDREKLLLLLNAPAGEPAAMRARRLAGIYVTLWRHPARIGLDPEIGDRMAAFLDSHENLRQIRKVAMAFLASRDTQRINEKMQNDIIPELQRLHSDFTRRFPSQAEMADVFDPERNPEWEELLRGSTLGDSLKELSDMQAQGGDVMMIAFSNLKNFNFFYRPGNWLLPFNASHPALKRVAESSGEMLELVNETADFLCDSDKYSLALAMERIPGGHGKMMLDQMRSQFEQYREEKSTSFKSDTEPDVDRQITLYVRSLSRLVNQFPRKGLRLPNPFAKAILPMTLPFLEGKLNSINDVETVSEFLFSRGYYDEALPALRQLEKMTPDSVVLLEKIGYSLQQTSDAENALVYYSRAETYSEHPGKWLLRKLATLNRALGNYDEAAKYWRQIAAANPDDSKAAMQLANSLFDAGDIEEALKNYYKVDYLRGGSERTWRPIAWCEFSLGNYEKAQEYYDRLLALGDDASDLLNAGHLALARGRMSNAITLYTRAAKAHPSGLAGLLAQLKIDGEILSQHGLDDESQSLLADRLSFAVE